MNEIEKLIFNITYLNTYYTDLVKHGAKDTDITVRINKGSSYNRYFGAQYSNIHLFIKGTYSKLSMLEDWKIVKEYCKSNRKSVKQIIKKPEKFLKHIRVFNLK